MIIPKEIAEKTAIEYSTKNKVELQELLKNKLIKIKKEFDGQCYEIEIELVNLRKNTAEIVVSAWSEPKNKSLIDSTDSYYLKFELK
jgi:hypothetical protein